MKFFRILIVLLVGIVVVTIFQTVLGVDLSDHYAGWQRVLYNVSQMGLGVLLFIALKVTPEDR